MGLILSNQLRNDPIVIYAFQDLLQISLDIFEEFVLDDMVSKNLSQPKRKVYLKGKIPLSQYEVGWRWFKSRGRRKFQTFGIVHAVASFAIPAKISFIISRRNSALNWGFMCWMFQLPRVRSR